MSLTLSMFVYSLESEYTQIQTLNIALSFMNIDDLLQINTEEGPQWLFVIFINTHYYS